MTADSRTIYPRTQQLKRKMEHKGLCTADEQKAEEALPQAASGSSEQGLPILYNKPHLLKPSFRDLSSTFIHTALEKQFLQVGEVGSVEPSEIRQGQGPAPGGE
ncbi:hypothetical protein DUI87_08239 [Hirundo rustica rustica]|uniref:Uncharacterized protein n=1 Tax=Hirundo rustica rustica TaxID=333673 RepID=A0A3M0KRV8_HIRRU|nr:hypothetical protein DUI87_08239 [Hirundo rustica rustica]